MSCEVGVLEALAVLDVLVALEADGAADGRGGGVSCGVGADVDGTTAHPLRKAKAAGPHINTSFGSLTAVSLQNNIIDPRLNRRYTNLLLETIRPRVLSMQQFLHASEQKNQNP